MSLDCAGGPNHVITRFLRWEASTTGEDVMLEAVIKVTCFQNGGRDSYPRNTVAGKGHRFSPQGLNKPVLLTPGL